MNQAIDNKPIHRPPARLPRETHAVSPARKRQKNQVGRSAPARLGDWIGELSIAVGWVFVFVAVFLPKDAANFTAILECAIAGAGLLGFGVGWHVRDERDMR